MTAMPTWAMKPMKARSPSAGSIAPVRARMDASMPGAVCHTPRVRQLVRRDRGETVSTRGASGLIGLGDSGGSDVARHKDEYVGEAVDAQHPRQ